MTVYGTMHWEWNCNMMRRREWGMESHPHYAPQIVGQEEARKASIVTKI